MNDQYIGANKNLGINQNVCIRVIDEPTGKIVQEHVGHNAATSTLLTGIGQFLLGGATTGAGQLLDQWIPKYISLGTMGLSSQEEDDDGLPIGVGDNGADDEEDRMAGYLLQCPGFGSDGYDTSLMNDRPYIGLGPMFADRSSESSVGCELISDTFPRAAITYRECLPENKSEIPKTIDVVFSAMISTGALAQFREASKDYIFITELGLWSTPTWEGEGNNGLLAGYRICPTDSSNWDMSVKANRDALKSSIIKIGTNQVAQVIWKIQLGAIEQMGGIDALYPTEGYIKWDIKI